MRDIYKKIILTTCCFLTVGEAWAEGEPSGEPIVNITLQFEGVSSSEGQFIV